MSPLTSHYTRPLLIAVDGVAHGDNVKCLLPASAPVIEKQHTAWSGSNINKLNPPLSSP